MIKGILFDVDGTLVDSNDAHAHAWQDAYAQYGYDIPFADIRRLIGMGGDKLMATLTPQLSESQGDGKKIAAVRPTIFLEQYAAGLQPTPGARELVEYCKDKGVQMVVATSAKQDEVDVLLRAANVADILTQATTSDDADSSKPDPDIVQAALERLGLPPNEVIMVGDTPYDIEAAAKAGVRCVAVRTGGWSDGDLKGALTIADDPEALVILAQSFGL